MKNMLGNILDDMLGNWGSTRNQMLATRAKLVALDESLANLDATFSWSQHAIVSRSPVQADSVGKGDGGPP